MNSRLFVGRIAITALGLLSVADRARAQDRIYLANDDHSDYMWSGDEAAYRAAYAEMLDYYVGQAEDTVGNPPDFRGRFNVDGTLWLVFYEQERMPSDFDRLVAQVRAGNITVPFQSLPILPGAMPLEAVIRDMYYAGRFERLYELNLDLVVMMENQTLPGGLASVWAGSGARYSWKGICDCATRIDARDRPREVYWFEGPDGKRILMRWNSVFGGNQSIGGYAEARDPMAALDLLSSPTFEAVWPYDVKAAFGYGWDDLSSTTDVFITTAMSASNASRRVIVSNEVDFFTDFDATYGAGLESFSGSFGNEWELLTASLAVPTAQVRNAVETLRAAEAMATLVSLQDPSFMTGRERARDAAFTAMGIYFDHSFSPGPGVDTAERIRYQRETADTVSTYVDDLFNDARGALGALVAGAGGEQHVVFNTLSTVRDDYADLEANPVGEFHVVDVSDGTTVASQRVTVGATTRVRVLARGVPALGYKTYEIRSGPGGPAGDAATLLANVFENAAFRLVVAGDGAITSAVAKNAGDREIVASGSALNRLGSGGGGAIMLENAGPVSATVRVAAGGTPAHTARITLYAAPIERVDLENEISDNFSDDQGYTFDVSLRDFTIRHEEVGMIATVGRVSDGGDYADDNARTDHLTLQRFVDLSEAGFGVTIANRDSSFMQVGDSTLTTIDLSRPRIRAIVGMPFDGGIGIGGQGGDSRFVNRYAIVAHGGYDASVAMNTALAFANPLVSFRATGPASAPYPAGRYTLLDTGDPAIAVMALKPAEEGIENGLIVRVWNMTGSPRTMRLTMPGHMLASANRASHVETDVAMLDVTDGLLEEPLEPQELATFRVSSEMLPPPILPDAGPSTGRDGGGTDRVDGGTGTAGDGDGCGCDTGRIVWTRTTAGLALGWGVVATSRARRRTRH